MGEYTKLARLALVFKGANAAKSAKKATTPFLSTDAGRGAAGAVAGAVTGGVANKVGGGDFATGAVVGGALGGVGGYKYRALRKSMAAPKAKPKVKAPQGATATSPYSDIFRRSGVDAGSFKTKADVQKARRGYARKNHPDLTQDAAEKARRQKSLSDVNAAFDDYMKSDSYTKLAWSKAIKAAKLRSARAAEKLTKLDSPGSRFRHYGIGVGGGGLVGGLSSTGTQIDGRPATKKDVAQGAIIGALTGGAIAKIYRRDMRRRYRLNKEIADDSAKTYKRYQREDEAFKREWDKTTDSWRRARKQWQDAWDDIGSRGGNRGRHRSSRDSDWRKQWDDMFSRPRGATGTKPYSSVFREAGIDPSTFRTKKDFNAAYRNFVKRNHPDRFTDPAEKAAQQKKFSEFTAAADDFKNSSGYTKLAHLVLSNKL